jgi:hypothetical protein
MPVCTGIIYMREQATAQAMRQPTNQLVHRRLADPENHSAAYAHQVALRSQKPECSPWRGCASSAAACNSIILKVGILGVGAGIPDFLGKQF